MRLAYHRAALFLAPIAISIILVTIATGRSAPFPIQYPALERTQGLLILFLQCGTAVCASHIAQKHMRRTATRQDAELHELEKRYHLLADHATDLIAVVGQDECIRYASPSFDSVMGHDPTALIGHNIRDYIHPDDLITVYRSGVDTSVNAAAHIIVRLRHANGTWLWVELACFRRSTNDEREIVAVGRDISERKRLEADLIHLHRLDSVGRIAGPLMHDVNNCLTGIGGVAALALEALPVDHQLREDLAAIGHAADRASTLAYQLLSFARKANPAPQALDLNALLHNLSPLLRPLIGPDIDYAMAPAPDLACVRGDPAELEQVILNLVLNARDAMPGGGQLRIETANIALSDASASLRNDRQPRAYVRLTISDTGIGMDAATQARIFEPYFTTKAPGRGSGLGLATCAEIVKRHNGVIHVDSALGHGTKITIELPCAKDQNDAPALAAEADASHVSIDHKS
jgi:PAS domain S-box-containing protein